MYVCKYQQKINNSIDIVIINTLTNKFYQNFAFFSGHFLVVFRKRQTEETETEMKRTCAASDAVRLK